MNDFITKVIFLYAIKLIVLLPVILYGSWFFYRKYIIKSLKSCSFMGSFIFLKDKEIADIIKKGVLDKKPERAAYYLRLLEELRIKDLKSDLINALNNENNEIKEYVINRIIDLKIYDAVEILFKIATDETENQRVRSFASNAYCYLMGEKSFEKLYLLFRKETVCGAVIGLFKTKDVEAIFVASEKLRSLIESDDTDLRAKAAKIIGYVGKDNHNFIYPLKRLENDNSKEVKKEVITALERIKSTYMVDYLITRLFEIEHKRDAINALISMSSSLIPVLKDIIENEKYKTNILVYLIEIIGKIMGRDGKDALLKCLINTKNRRVKEAVLKALNNKSVIVEKSYIKDINKLIYKEMKNISFLISCLVNIEEDGNENDFKEVVINAIIDDINQAKLRVVGMVNLFLKEKVDCKNILIKDNLDNIKACGIKLGKIEAFNNLPYKIILGRIDKDFKNNKKDIKESLSQIITSDFEMTTKWLRACGLKLAYLVDKDYFLKDFEKATTDPASVVRETAYKVLYKGDK